VSAETPEWAKDDPADVLVYHQREKDGGGCICGWFELGRSHAVHQVTELHEAGYAVVRIAPTCGAMTGRVDPLTCLLPTGHEGWHKGLGSTWSLR
jgi:hypothetical protein